MNDGLTCDMLKAGQRQKFTGLGFKLVSQAAKQDKDRQTDNNRAEMPEAIKTVSGLADCTHSQPVRTKLAKKLRLAKSHDGGSYGRQQKQRQQ